MYSDYAKYFDKIFPASKGTVNFLSKHLIGHKILDIGCGSGEYAIGLYNNGYDITGIDLDSEMISYARNKNSNIDFSVMNMLKMDEEKFDSIYCIGNTLVHLSSINEIKEFLKLCNRKINNGTLILQIINYDRIIDSNITSLPTIENDDIKFVRDYLLKDDKVVFSTRLTVKDKVFENSVELLPLRQSELVRLLNEAGFNNVKCYSGFTDNEYSKESFALVVVASK